MRGTHFRWAATVLAAGLLAWLLLGDRSSSRGSGGGGEAATEADDASEIGAGTDPGNAASAGVPGLRGSEGRATASGLHDDEAGGASIAGIVLEDGVPIAATVEARRWPPRRPGFSRWSQVAMLLESCDASRWLPRTSRSTRSGADGRFLIDGLPPGDYVVAALTEGGIEGSTSTNLYGNYRVDLRILVPTEPGTAALSGRIVLGDGRPWRGQVGVRPTGRRPGAGGSRSSLVTTDGDGRFALTGLLPGWVDVHAYDGERHASSGPVRVPYDGEWAWNIDEGTVEVAGRVVSVPDGGGIGGATVIGGGIGQPGALALEGHARTTTSADGSFRVRILPRDARLAAEAPGYAPGTAWVDGPNVPVEIRLGKTARVEGLVTSDSGAAPAAGAVVHAVAADPWGRDVRYAGTTADARGRYVIDGLPPGDVALVVRGGGWIGRGMTRRGEAGARVALPGGGTVTVDLVATRGAQARGVVVDAAGAPVPNLRVGVSEEAESVDGYLDSAVTQARFGMELSTGRDGRFALDDLLPGARYRFTVIAAGGMFVFSDLVRASLEAPIDVRITIPSSRWLTATVVEKGTGKPVPRATVSVGWSVRDQGGQGASGPPTDADGVTRVGPIPGGDALEVIPSAWVDGWWASSSPKYAFPAGQAEGATRIEMTRGTSIAGRVVVPEGAVWTGATIQASRPQTGQQLSAQAWPPDGEFRFGTLTEGTWKLSATASGPAGSFRGSAEAEAGRKDVRIVLEPAVKALVVRITDRDGLTPATAHVWVTGKGRDRNVSTSYRFDGTLVIEDERRFADLDELRVTVGRAARRDGSPLPLGPATVVVPRGTKEVTVVLPPEKVLVGRVVDPSGAGLARSYVLGGPVEGNAPGVDTWTASDGTFRLGNLADGRIQISVTPPAPWLAPDAVIAAVGDPDVRVVVKPSASATLRIVDPEGRGVKHAMVQVTGRSVNQSLAADEDGTVAVSRIPTDTPLTVTVSPPGSGDRPDLIPAKRENWYPHDETIVLERAWTITGFVRDLAGDPVPNAVVTAGDRTGWNAWTAWNGQFRFDRIPSGDVVLRVRFPADDERTVRGECVVRAGTSEVTLVVDTGTVLDVRFEGLRPGVSVAQATLIPRDGGPPSRLIPGAQRQDGMRFYAVTPGARYALWAGPLPCAFVDPVVAGEGPIVVRLVPPTPISVTVRGPAGMRVTSVRADLGGYAVNAANPENPSLPWRIDGLPAGSWTVRVMGRTKEGKSLEGWSVSRSGAADIDLRESR